MAKPLYQSFLTWGKLSIVFYIFIGGYIYSQNLVNSWEKYSSIDSKISKANFQKNQLEQQQYLQQEGIRKLQESSFWYNGWYIKMLLSRKSTDQLILADSIQAIHLRIEKLTHERKNVFNNLINTYKHILLDSLAGNNLSMIEKLNAVMLGRWLMDRPKENINLPDYAYIMDSQYDDIGIKNIVMKDMKILLEQKIFLIDSLLDERRLENELAERLSEFHHDLELQMESEMDISTSDNRIGFAVEAFASDGEYTTQISADYFESDLIKNNENRFVSLGFGPLLKTDKTYQMGFEKNLNNGELVNLKSKRQQYQELLKKIDKELNY